MLTYHGKSKKAYLPYLKGNTIAFFQSHLHMLGRTNLVQIDIPTTGAPAAYKPYSIQSKYQMFVNEEMTLFENTGSISNTLSLWATPVIMAPKKPDA